MTARTAAAAILVGGVAGAPASFARNAVDGFEPVKVAVLLTAVLAAAALVPRWLDPREGSPKRVHRPAAIALAWLAAAALASAFSTSPLVSLVGADESHAGLVMVGATVALFLAARELGGSTAARAALLTASVAGTSVAAAYGAAQALGADPLPWTRVAGLTGWSRPFGTMGHPNHLGGLLAVVLPFQLWAARAAFTCRLPVAGALTSAGLALSAAVLVTTLSRAAWTAAAAGLAVAVGLELALHGRRPLGPSFASQGRRLRLLTAGAVLLAVIVGGLLLPATASRGTLRGALAERARSFAALGPRLPIWQAAASAFRESPFLGSGLDTFALAFQRHRPPHYWTREYDATPTKAHNDLLHALATQGLVGGFAWCLVAGGGIWLGFAAARHATGPERGLAAALLGGWVAFLVHVQAGFAVVALVSVLVAWATVLGGLRSTARGAGPPADDPLAGTRGFWVPTVAAAGAFVLGFASDDTSLGLGSGAGQAVLAAVVLIAASQAWAVHGVTSRLRQGIPGGRAPEGRDGARGALAKLCWASWVAVCLAAWVLVVPRPFAASVAAHRAETAPTPADAVRLLTAAHRLDPLRVTWLRRLGLALSNTVPPEGLERLEESREALLRAARLVPADAYGWASLVVPETRLAAAGSLDRDQPFRSLEEALRLDTANVTFRTAGANAALELGDLPRARRYAGEAAAMLPAFAPARAQLAHVAAREGRLDDALRQLREALALEWYGQVEARHVAQANLASLLSRAGRFGEAEGVARALVSEAPLFAPGHYQLARALEGLGRTAEAASEYGATLRFDPNHRGAEAALGGLRSAEPHSK